MICPWSVDGWVQHRANKAVLGQSDLKESKVLEVPRGLLGWMEGMAQRDNKYDIHGYTMYTHALPEVCIPADSL